MQHEMAVFGSSAHHGSAQPQHDNRDIECGILALIQSKDKSNSVVPAPSQESAEKNITVDSFYTHSKCDHLEPVTSELARE